MARIRLLKPGFFTNDDLAELPPLDRILFAGLWTLADREGRLEDRPKKIKAQVLPYDDHDVDAALTRLESSGFLLRYEVDGHRFILVTNFSKHQNPNTKELPSSIPAPRQHHTSTVPVSCQHMTSTVSILHIQIQIQIQIQKQIQILLSPLPPKGGVTPQRKNRRVSLVHRGLLMLFGSVIQDSAGKAGTRPQRFGCLTNSTAAPMW